MVKVTWIRKAGYCKHIRNRVGCVGWPEAQIWPERATALLGQILMPKYWPAGQKCQEIKPAQPV